MQHFGIMSKHFGDLPPIALVLFTTLGVLLGPLTGYVMAKLVGVSKLPSIATGLIFSLGTLVIIIACPSDRMLQLLSLFWHTILFGFGGALLGYLLARGDTGNTDPHKWAVRVCIMFVMVTLVAGLFYLVK